MHLSHLLAQFIRTIYKAVEKSYCSLRWLRLLPSLVSVATSPLVYMGKVTFSNYLPCFQPVSEHTSLPAWKHGGETQHQINSQISTGHDFSTIKTMPSNTSKAGEGHHSQHQPSYGRFSHFYGCKAGNHLATVLSVIYLYVRYFTSRRVIHSVAVLMASRISHFLACNNLPGKASAKGKSSQSPAVRICPSQTS